jgi:hypothetical protein
LSNQLCSQLAGAETVGDFDPFKDFRQIVRNRLTSDGRAFLLVLDTMEVVQYDRKALDGVMGFLDRLSLDMTSGKSQPAFPELRVVAAGRG